MTLILSHLFGPRFRRGRAHPAPRVVLPDHLRRDVGLPVDLARPIGRMQHHTLRGEAAFARWGR